MTFYPFDIYDRLQDESEFFDREIQRKAGKRRGYRFTNQLDYEQYFSLQRPYQAVKDFLGSVRGKEILDFACGTGWASVYFARSGANCHGLDISVKSIEAARLTAEINGLSQCCTFKVGAGEAIPYDDNTFDLIFGNAALHHVDLEMIPEELARVLKPGGKAAFIDDLLYHPLLWMYRKVSRRRHTLFETPLTLSDLQWFKHHFSTVQAQVFDIVNLAPKNRLISGIASRFDDALLAAIPGLKHICRYVVIKLVK